MYLKGCEKPGGPEMPMGVALGFMTNINTIKY
jgi:hypothetical protein